MPAARYAGDGDQLRTVAGDLERKSDVANHRVNGRPRAGAERYPLGWLERIVSDVEQPVEFVARMTGCEARPYPFVEAGDRVGQRGPAFRAGHGSLRASSSTRRRRFSALPI
jgi:hypothetical protein